MARAGLGSEWKCLFANDFDARKAASYRRNWGGEHLLETDIKDVHTNDLPGKANLAWASFPCQDLSLAGNGLGLVGARSGTFWRFWDLVRRLRAEARAPQSIVLENVVGAITSHDGKDFAAILEALVAGGYNVGALVMDAAHFLPQSRPRLFIVALDASLAVPKTLFASAPSDLWHPTQLRNAYDRLPAETKRSWLWWCLPKPEGHKTTLRDLIEQQPHGVKWHTPEETKRLLSMMSERNIEKVENAKRQGTLVVGTIYRRTRANEHGERRQRAEVRFDNVAGCLRTPVGGSSRQTLIVIEGQYVLTRLISPREAARLMGLPDTYQLPANYNDAYHLAGDGLAVPVVRFLAHHLLEPLLEPNLKRPMPRPIVERTVVA